MRSWGGWAGWNKWNTWLQKVKPPLLRWSLCFSFFCFSWIFNSELEFIIGTTHTHHTPYTTHHTHGWVDACGGQCGVWGILCVGCGVCVWGAKSCNWKNILEDSEEVIWPNATKIPLQILYEISSSQSQNFKISKFRWRWRSTMHISWFSNDFISLKLRRWDQLAQILIRQSP